MLGMLARKMWTAEHLTRDNQWGYWHPYLPFLGDEVTGRRSRSSAPDASAWP